MIEIGEKFEMFPSGEKPIDGPFLRHIPDRLPDTVRILDRIQSENRRRAGRRMEQGDQNAKGGTLPCAVWSEQAENFSRIDLERQVIHGLRPYRTFSRDGTHQ